MIQWGGRIRGGNGLPAAPIRSPPIYGRISSGRGADRQILLADKGRGGEEGSRWQEEGRRREEEGRRREEEEEEGCEVTSHGAAAARHCGGSCAVWVGKATVCSGEEGEVAT